MSLSDLRGEPEEDTLQIGIGLKTIVLICELRLWPLPASLIARGELGVFPDIALGNVVVVAGGTAPILLMTEFKVCPVVETYS